jgi:hypothetical protein
MILSEINLILFTGNDLNLENAGIMGAVFFGAILGFLLEEKYINFSRPRIKLFYLTRLVIGFFLIAFSFLLPKLFLVSNQIEIEILRHITQYFLVGFFIAFVAPYFFTNFEKMINQEE